MIRFPLAAFLESLQVEGLRLTVRDYERIQLALSADGEWNRARLADTLAGLLARGKEEEDSFRRKFDRFFAADRDLPLPPVDLGLEEAIASLKAAREAEPFFYQEERRIRQPGEETGAVEPEKRLVWKWAVAGLAVVVIGLVFLPDDPPPPPPPNPLVLPNSAPLVALPSPVNFGPRAAKTNHALSVVVSNAATESVSPGRWEMSGPGSNVFSFSKEVPARLNPGGTFTNRITFRPEPGISLSAQLSLLDSNAEPLLYVSLIGAGTTNQPATDRTGRLPDRLYSFPEITVGRPSRVGERVAAAFSLLIGLAALMGAWRYWRRLARLHQPPRAVAPGVNPETGERHEYDLDRRLLDLPRLGGPMEERLPREALDRLADAMGYFQSERPGRVLDVDRTIDATMQRGGVPRFEFASPKRIKTLLVLEDARAEAREWNSVPRELAAGMRRRGVPVIFGRFHGAPDRYVDQHGTVRLLEDLDEARHGILLLIFSDGRRLRRENSRFAMEAVARWPKAAWMELREPRFWDESTAAARAFGLPVWPATAEGLLSAFRTFLTERGGSGDGWSGAGSVRLPVRPSAGEMERLLGDAHAWAQDCAVMPVLTPGLADKLRRKRHPHLPPEAIERLYMLPGVAAREDEIHLPEATREILLAEFRERRLDQRADQEDLLAMAERELATILPGGGEPDLNEPNNLAELRWWRLRSALRRQLDPAHDYATELRLAAEDSPLSAALRGELAAIVDDGDRVLLHGPPPPRARRRIEAGLGREVAPERFAAAEWTGLSLRVMAGLAVCLLALTWKTDPPPFVVEGVEDMRVVLETAGEADLVVWRPVFAGTPAELSALRREALRERVRVTFLHPGARRQAEFALTDPGTSLFVRAAAKPDRLPPVETLRPGLTLQRMPAAPADAVFRPYEWPSWRKRVGSSAGYRLLSVGLEFTSADTPELAAFRNALLESGSVDFVFRFDLAQLGLLTNGNDPRLIRPLQQAVTVSLAGYDPAQMQTVAWLGAGLSAEQVTNLFLRGDLLRLETPEQRARTLALMGNQPLTGAQLIAAGVVAAEAGEGARRVVLPPAGGRIPEDMSLIPGGEFTMGDSNGVGFTNERPAHQVYVSAFVMDRYEVTKEKWDEVYRWAVTNGYDFDNAGEADPGARQPVHTVNWFDALKWANALSEKEGLKPAYYTSPDQSPALAYRQGQFNLTSAMVDWTGPGYRLPTEAEWERAARGGLDGNYFPWAGKGGDPVSHISTNRARYGWIEAQDELQRKKLDGSVAVGSYPANEFGLYDMAGNLYEWTWDWYDELWYGRSESRSANTHGPQGGQRRVLRGGGWFDSAEILRCALRGRFEPDGRLDFLGFRLVQGQSPAARSPWEFEVSPAWDKTRGGRTRHYRERKENEAEAKGA